MKKMVHIDDGEMFVKTVKWLIKFHRPDKGNVNQILGIPPRPLSPAEQAAVDEGWERLKRILDVIENDW